MSYRIEETIILHKDGVELFTKLEGCDFMIFLLSSSDSLDQVTILLLKIVVICLFKAKKRVREMFYSS